MPALVIDIEARFAKFQDGLDKIQRDTKRTADGMSRAFSGVGSALAALGVGIGVGAFAAMFADIVKTRGALDDLADTTGDSVQSLDGLRRQANVAGVDFEALGGTLAKFARNLNSADDEGKAAGQAIQAIGLNLAEIQAKKPADALRDVALALGKFEDGASKVAVAVALMGKEGAKMLPLLKDIATDGATAGRITGEQAAEAEKLEKEWRRLKQTFIDGKDALADGMIPAISKLVSEMKEGIRVAGGFGQALLLFGTINPFKSLRENMATASNEIERLEKLKTKLGDSNTKSIDDEIVGQRKRLEFLKFQEREQALLNSGQDARDLKAQQKPALEFKPTGKEKESKADPFGQMREKFEKELAGMSAGANKVSAELESALTFDKALSKIPEAQKEILRNLAAEVDLRKQSERAVKAQLEGQEELNQAGRDSLKAADDYRLKQLEAGEAIRKQLDPTIALREELAKIAKLVNEGFLSPEDGESMFERLNVDFLKAQAALNNFGEEVKKVDDFAKDMGLTFSSAFEDAIVGGKKLSDVLKGLGADIARIITRKTITEPLGNAATNIFKNFNWGSLFSGGSGGGLNLSSYGGAMASGTDYVPRDMLAFLHKGEAVVPASQNAGGGITINQNMTFGSDVNRATLMAWGQQIRQQSVAAVFELQKRGA